MKLWLLVQSLAFNFIIHPGLSINQLRFFTGMDAQLSASEILKEFEDKPLLYTGEDQPATPIIAHGLQIHLNTQPRNGIIGLRARRNPMPIDLGKVDYYDIYDYFAPLKELPLRLEPRQYYLFYSKEFLDIPPHLNVELHN